MQALRGRRRALDDGRRVKWVKMLAVAEVKLRILVGEKREEEVAVVAVVVRREKLQLLALPCAHMPVRMHLSAHKQFVFRKH